MLSPELIRKIRRIHIRTGRMVDSILAGQYHSAFKGAGIEFEEVREYVPGDDVKAIDWNVTARMGRPYIKRYREERELLIVLLVDVSASGVFGTAGALKREAAAETAALLAFNAIRNNDKVGAVLFSDVVERYIPPKKGAAHVWRVIREVLSHRPQGGGTDIGEAVRFFARVTRKRAVAFVISDFIDEGFEKDLAVAGRRHDMIGVVMSDPGEFRLPRAGLLSLVDLETGERVVVDASDRRSAEAWRRNVRSRYLEVLERLRRAGVDPVEMSTEGSPVEPLRRFFESRRARR